MYVCMYIYMREKDIYIYIYIERDRERDKSAAGLQGNSSRNRSVFFTDTGRTSRL